MSVYRPSSPHKLWPVMLAHDAPNMRFRTTHKILIFKEFRYLLFTETGPVEIGFHPIKALQIMGCLLLLSGAAMVMTPLLPLKPLYQQSIDYLAGQAAHVKKEVGSQFAWLSEKNTIGNDEQGGDLSPFSSPKTDPGQNGQGQNTQVQNDPGQRDQAKQGAGDIVTAGGLGSGLLDSLTERERRENKLPPEDETKGEYESIPAVRVDPDDADLLSPEDVAPIARPKAEPMDPEYVGYDSLAQAPLLDERIRLNRLFARYMGEADQVQQIIQQFGITLDNAPAEWTYYDEDPQEALIPALFLHRENWLGILNAIPLTPPLRYYYVTSRYGWRTNKKTGVKRFHHGVDLGSTWRAMLHPPTRGQVIFAGREGSFGNVVRIQHAHNIETIYAHLSSINVKTGDFVSVHDILGKIGNTGRSDGMHLHYEIRINGKSIDPERFFKIGHQISLSGNLPGDAQL